MAESNRHRRRISTKLVYRVVRDDPPRRRDFLSDAALGRPRVAWESERDHHGISVWAAVRQARVRALAQKQARGLRWLFVAEIPVQQGGPLQAWRSGPTPGHYTLSGKPDVIRSLARVIQRV